MTIGEWTGECLKYEKNKKGMEFDVSVTVPKDSEEVKVKLILTPEFEKYRKALHAIIEKMIEGALNYGIQLLPTKDVEDADKDAFVAQWEKEFERDKEFYFNILLKEGMDPFLAALMSAQKRQEAAYFLTKVKPIEKNGKVIFCGPCGTYFKDGSWRKETNGREEIRCGCGLDWSILLGEDMIKEAV